MAIRLRQRKAIVRTLAEYFVKIGKVPANRREYGAMEDAPIRVSQLTCYFGAWGGLLSAMQIQEPELWAKITAPKPVEAPKPAPKPKEAPKPAPKPAAPKAKPAPAKVAPKAKPTPVVKKEN